jgi:hypothetical protein
MVATRALTAALAGAAAYLGAHGAPVAPMLGAAVGVTLAAALAWRTRAQWDDRVELWGDRLVSWEGERPESFVLDEVERFDARLSPVRGGVDLETPVGLAVVMADGRVLHIEEVALREARPLMQLVGAVVLERWYATLRRGGTVVCADAPPFPWALAGLAAFGTATMAWLFAQTPRNALGTLLRGAPLMWSGGRLTRRALRTWWAARRTGGVEMSAAGIRPLKAPRAEARLDATPYRAVAHAAAGFTPWPAVGDAYIDGFGLWVHCADRAESLALSGRAENFFVVNEFVAALRAARVGKAPAMD